MSCKKNKNRKNVNNKNNNLLTETIKKEATSPANIQDNNIKSM